MSYDEKRNQNRWRLQKEITIGDLVVILGIAWFLITDHFTLAQLKEQVVMIEVQIRQHADKFSELTKDVAILETKFANKHPQP